jgi:hypothetical protein
MNRIFIILIALAALFGNALAQQTVKGVVFIDADKNGSFDVGEMGVPDVCISNGIDVTQTDATGRWALPVDDDTGIFVVKPSGYAVPVNNTQIPQYSYLHKPNGSPQLTVPGVPATGPLPESIDFPLYPADESGPFSALLFGDPQARGSKEVNFISRDVVQECIGTDAVFGISLGDMVADDPSLFKEISESIAQIGIPWYNIFGNHDHNRAAKEDEYKDETFERFFGPSTFAFEYGQSVFIGFKNIFYQPNGKYKSRFTMEQIAFVRNYLQSVPKEKLIVLMMHAPILRSENREEIYALIKDRPHTLSISGHTHQMAHVFIDENMGWPGKEPHHHFINATVSGSWWCGMYDELGIPHATMNDGAPNGYSIVTFDGNEYSIRFKAARKPADYQMNIYVLDDILQSQADTTKVLVNVFAGSERSKVEMQFGADGKWITMQQVFVRDPACLRMHQLAPYLDMEKDGVTLDMVFGWRMDFPSKSRHIWQGALPLNPPKGTHTITIRTTDTFGRRWTAHRIVRIR